MSKTYNSRNVVQMRQEYHSMPNYKKTTQKQNPTNSEEEKNTTTKISVNTSSVIMGIAAVLLQESFTPLQKAGFIVLFIASGIHITKEEKESK